MIYVLRYLQPSTSLSGTLQPRMSFVFPLSRSLRVVTYPTLSSVSDTPLAQSRSIACGLVVNDQIRTEQSFSDRMLYTPYNVEFYNRFVKSSESRTVNV